MVTADAFSSSFVPLPPPPPSDYANAQRRSGRHCRLVLPRNLAQRRCWKRGDSWSFMFVTHCTRKEASHATSGSLFAKSMPVAICPNQTLIQPMIRRKRAMSNNASLQNEREGRVYPSGPRRRFIPSFLPSFFHLAKYPHSASSSLWSEHARLLTSIAPSLSFSILFRRRRPPPRNGRRGGGGRTSQSAAEVGLIIIAVVLPPSLPLAATR